MGKLSNLTKWEPCLEPAVDPELPGLVLQLAEAGHELWLDGGQLARVVLALVDVLGQPQHGDVEQSHPQAALVGHAAQHLLAQAVVTLLVQGDHLEQWCHRDHKDVNQPHKGC